MLRGENHFLLQLRCLRCREATVQVHAWVYDLFLILRSRPSLRTLGRSRSRGLVRLLQLVSAHARLEKLLTSVPVGGPSAMFLF